jgi:hypothetical protein
MKRILCSVVLTAVLVTPAFAAKVYLKEGGVIQAKKIWREGGKVRVWITRDTMTTFEASEINLKRTFVKRHRAAKKIAAVQPQAQTTAATPSGATASPKAADKKVGITLPNLPKLSEKTPESLVPSSGAGGSIKQHKKEMAEKTGE